MTNPSASIDAIYRYPVKGLSPQPMERVTLAPRATLPADRLYAIENGPSGYNPAAPKFIPKQRFLVLMRNEQLATLRTTYDEATHTLTIGHKGREAARGDLRTPEGRQAIEAFFRGFMPDELRGPPKVLFGDQHSFSDVGAKVVSIINRATVDAVAGVAAAAVNPLRFRANLYVSGWPAWHEFDLLGSEIEIGGVRLKLVKRTVRCAATNVDPETGARDLTIPATLQQNFGHADCGVYAEVLAGGDIAIGDAITAAA